MKKVNIPIFVSHRGCPHDCVFCNQKRITGQSGSVSPSEAEKIIEDALLTIDKTSNVEIAFFGGSFTAIDKEEQESLLKVAYKYIKEGKVAGIRLSTRPDCIDKEGLSLLKKYGVTSIELGVQSTNEEVLYKSARGHTYQDAVNAAHLINEFGFELGLQMMLGLPCDTKERSVQTAQDIISLSPKTTRIYPTIVIRDSILEKMYERGEYVPLTLDEAVEWSAVIYTMFKGNNIEVLRMGLMASVDMCEGKGIVAGPFHPSFGELVFSRIYLDKMRSVLKDFHGEKIVFYVNQKDVSKAVGNKRKNLQTLKDEYNVNVFIKGAENVASGEILC